jgi:hypothetical protein
MIDHLLKTMVFSLASRRSQDWENPRDTHTHSSNAGWRNAQQELLQALCLWLLENCLQVLFSWIVFSLDLAAQIHNTTKICNIHTADLC